MSKKVGFDFTTLPTRQLAMKARLAITREGILAQIDARLAQINGQRRCRLASREDALQAVREAIERGYGWTHGGRVANSYGYSAAATCTFAWRLPSGRIALKIGKANAHKSSSPVTWAGPYSQRDADIRKWMAAAETNAEIPTSDVIVIPLAVATMLTRTRAEIPADLQARMDSTPDVRVTLADSLGAGNCPIESERVAAWFKGRPQPAKRLLLTVAKRAPHLLPFTLRAVDHAIVRHQHNN